MSLLKKMNDSNLHFLWQPTIAAGYEQKSDDFDVSQSYRVKILIDR